MESGRTDGADGTESIGRVEESQEQRDRIVLDVLIPSKRRDSVLAEALGNGVLRLPRTELPVGVYPARDRIDELETYIEAQVGVYGYLVRYLCQNGVIHVADGVEKHKMVLVDIIESESSIRKPLEWVRREIACKSKWEEASAEDGEGHVSSKVEAVFKEIYGETRIDRDAAWDTVGWFENVESWTRGVLESRNMEIEGRIRRRHFSGSSTVMVCDVKNRGQRSAQDEQGRSVGRLETLFIKASIPMRREGQRTAAIRRVLGNIVPEVIATHDTQGLMVQRDAGKITDEALDEEALVRTILKMQTVSMNGIRVLEAGGVRVADSDWVERNVEWIVNHEVFDELCKSEECNERTKGKVEVLRLSIGEIQKGCRKYASFGLPRTIVHGDWRVENFGSPMKGDEKVYRIFDWEYAYIGSPLEDLETFLFGGVYEEEGYEINGDAILKQIGQHWMPDGTREQLKTRIDFASLMSWVIRIHDVCQQYDACDDSCDISKARVLKRMFETLEEFDLANTLGNSVDDMHW